MGDVDDFGRQFCFVVFAAGKRGARPLFKWERQRHSVVVTGFAEFRQNKSRNIDGTLGLVGPVEQLPCALAQSFAVAIDGPDKRVRIRDSERRGLRVHGTIC